jgi:hypothetical protein
MPFKNQDARNAYSRDYMRRRRAGQPQPKRERAPGPWDMYNIERAVSLFQSKPWRLLSQWEREFARKMIDDGIDLETDEGQRVAIQRYRAGRSGHRAALKAQREARKREEAAERDEAARRKAEWEIDRQRCRICSQLPSADRIIVEHAGDRVCELCVQQLTAKVAAMRAEDAAEREIKRCNFCGKVRAEVRLLVKGLDGVRICDECVTGVVQIVEERRLNSLTTKDADATA